MNPTLQIPDAQEGRTGSLVEFFKAQPAKYWIKAAVWLGGVMMATVTCGFVAGHWTARLQSANEITQKQSELDHRNAIAAGTQAVQIAELNGKWESRLASETSALRKEVTDLKVQNSALLAKVEGAEGALAKRDSELAAAQASNRSLAESAGAAQRALLLEKSEHNRQVDALKGCKEYKTEIERAAARARELRLELDALPSGASRRAGEIKIELDALDVTARNNGQLFMTSCNR